MFLLSKLFKFKELCGNLEEVILKKAKAQAEVDTKVEDAEVNEEDEEVTEEDVEVIEEDVVGLLLLHGNH